jgi:hypothetical protein
MENPDTPELTLEPCRATLIYMFAPAATPMFIPTINVPADELSQNINSQRALPAACLTQMTTSKSFLDF